MKTGCSRLRGSLNNLGVTHHRLPQIHSGVKRYLTAHAGNSCVATIRLMLGILVTLLTLISPTVSYAAAGDLDPSFGSNGKVITDLGGEERGGGVAIQPDGKTIVAGDIATYINNKSNYDFVLVRYDTNGSLDTTFGNGGKVITEFGGVDRATDITLEPNGKIIAAGTTVTFNNFVAGPTGNDFAIARYTPDGNLDSSFAVAGKLTLDIGADDRVFAVTAQPDGKIIVAGYTERGESSTSAPTDSSFALVRLNSDGSLDGSFANGGILITRVGLFAGVRAIALQPDGKIVAAGYSLATTANSDRPRLTLARYNSNGSLDSGFGTSGIVMTGVAVSASAIGLQSDGKIVAAGTDYSDFVLLRYNINGTPDTSFGNRGVRLTDFSSLNKDAGGDAAQDLVIAPNDQIIVAGTTAGPTFIGCFCGYMAFAIARYTKNGDLDISFGQGGILTTDFIKPVPPDYPAAAGPNALRLQTDGKLVVVGTSYHNLTTDFVLARYLGGYSGTIQPGWWWNPNESGRGFSIEVSQNTLVMAGYLYDNLGRAFWLTSAGPMVNSSLYQGTLQSFTNGQTLTGAYKSNVLVNANVGPIMLQFSDATHGTLTWPSGSFPIEHYVFGTGASSFQPESGWWWNESESGRGFTLEVQGNKLVIGGYMYDDSGNPVWYLSAGNMASPMLYQGQWEQYANGQPLTGTYKKPDLVNANVGSITLQFTSKSTAVLTLPGGRQINLSRYRF